MSDLASTSTVEWHTLGFFPPEIWSLLLDSLSLREVLLLSETGDKRVYKRVKSGLQRLELCRTQIIPQRISPTFISSWNSLIELNLDGIHSLSDGSYSIHVNMLPPSLRSLEMIIKRPSDLSQFLAPLTDPQLTATCFEPYLPHLTKLQIDNQGTTLVLDIDKALYEPFGHWIQKLPLLDLTLSFMRFPPEIVLYLPTTLQSIALKLTSKIDSTNQTQFLLESYLPSSSLTCLHLSLDMSVDWSKIVIPSTVTDLDVSEPPHVDQSKLWHFLPPHLVSLHIKDSTLIDVGIASQLPQTLQSLTFDTIDKAAIAFLPRSLTSLKAHNSNLNFSFDPILLPPSLTHLQMDLYVPPENWKSLPRGLTEFDYQNSFVQPLIAHISSLPPSLTNLVLEDPVSELIQALPCQRTIESLRIYGSGSYSLNNCISLLTNFSSLSTLQIMIDADLSQLSLLNAPLHTLMIDAEESRLSVMEFSPSCHRSLRYLVVAYTNRSRQEQDTQPIPPPRWLLSLPPSLLRCDISRRFIAPSWLSHLPPSCRSINFAVDSTVFDYNQLSCLPQRLTQVGIGDVSDWAVDSDWDINYVPAQDLAAPKISLIDLLNSLPRRIDYFSASLTKVQWMEPESTWVDIFSRCLSSRLSFLRTFHSGNPRLSKAFLTATNAVRK